MTTLLPWQATLWQSLRKAIKKGRCGNALLFTGPEGSGKSLLARHFAQALLCKTQKDGQLWQAGTHPDFKWLDSPKIDEIREVCEQVYQTAQQGTAKVIVICNAHKMNTAASNAFLKTLEEPPAHTYFVLIAPQASLLRATIRSRCQKVVMSVPTDFKSLESILHSKVLVGLERKDPFVLAQEWGKEEILPLLHTLSLVLIEKAKDNYRGIETLKLLDYFDLVNKTKRQCEQTTGLNRQLLLENLLIKWRQIVC